MKPFTNPLLKSLLATAVLTGACASAWADNKPARDAVPTVNYSRVSGIGEYVAEHASEDQYALFQRDKGLTTMVFSYAFGEEGSRSCVAQVGLTHAPVGAKEMHRLPATYFYGGASDPSLSKDMCISTAVRRAVDVLLGIEAKQLQDDLDQTLPSGGERPVKKAGSTLVSYRSSGISDKGNQYIREITPDWFSIAFDYRTVTNFRYFRQVEGDNGQLICFAAIGLTAEAPTERSPKKPSDLYARARTLNKSERAKADEDATCFNPLFDKLIADNIQPDADMIKSFIKNWAQVAEPGLKAPTMKDVHAAVAWQAERDRKAAAAKRAQEARQQRVAQQNSCTVNCVNGACIRQWPNGRSERFQAPRKFNPFTSQWEWDTSGC